MMDKKNHQSVIKIIIFMMGFGLIFGIIYAQSPLYTSNQNQYFLHGAADAGLGNLDDDWLANTLDPTPVFSQLIRITYFIPFNEVIFYLEYVVLMGIYLYSLIRITSNLFILQGRLTMVILLTLIVLIHSAAMRLLLARGVGDEWTFVLEGGVAGQRVLGAVFQPSTFGVLLVLSLYLFLKDKPILAIIVASAAVYFHPTYLLSTGILVCAYMGTIILLERRVRKAALVGFCALILVAPILLYVLQSFGMTNQNAHEAQAILVNFRIPHHAIVSEWFDGTTIIQLGLISVALWLVRKTKLFPVILISITIAIALTLLQVITGNNSLALIFPWRISVILVPLATVLILAYLVQELSIRNTRFLERNSTTIQIVCGLTLGLLVLAGGLRFGIEFTEKDQVIEQAVYQFVRDTQREGDVYLIPTKMQDFRLETGAPVFVDFKSIPYSEDEVLEWHRRILLATEFYEAEEIDCKTLDRFEQEGISRIVLEYYRKPLSCISTQEIYQDLNYRIYQFNKP
jgi:hypothetical protein